MRGTSSTSFAEVLRQTESALAGNRDGLEAAAQELFSVADAIDSSNQLVRTLSDPGRPAEVKEATVRSLFGDRVSPRTLEACLEVVRRRWSEQEDILDALELLGVSTLLEQAQSEGVLEQVEGDLFEISRLIDDSGDLTATLDGLRENPSQRATILHALLDGRTHRLSAALAARAVGRRSETKPARRVEEFARFASIVVGVPSRRSQRCAAERGPAGPAGAVLAAIYGREVQMNLQVDPDVVGGLRIQVGDDLYDATVLARLSRARSQLVA